MNKTPLSILAVLCASLAMADDFKTTDGKEYKNVKVSRVEPDGIVVITKSGISKLYFTELPKDVQERFNYDPEKAAAAYAAKVAAAQQAEELKKQRRAAYQARERQWAEQYAGEQNIKALTDRIGKLQQQEDNLLAEIGQIDSARETARRMWLSGTTQGYYTDPREAQLPLLRQRLDNVRADRERVRQELQQAQRQP
ncbi:MAG: hypothetical protein DME85_14360 [Verrucomicrobia bacterium]|nr:MAG: hypothetical protein DME85_14360 [Verrucomicrobiota bacterium]